MRLNKQEMMEIKGGATTASFINAVTKAFEFIFELGQSIGKNLAKWFQYGC